MAFNINAQVVLSGPQNIRAVRRSIQNQLGGINSTVNVQLDRAAKTNLSNLNRQLTSTNNILRQVNTNATQANAAIQSLSRTTKQAASSAKSLQGATKSVGSSFGNIAQGASQAGSALEGFGKDAALAIRRFTAFTVATGAIFGFVNAIKQGVSESIKFERELARVTQVTGATATELKGLESTIDGLAASLGLNANELAKTSVTLAQTGQTIDQVKKSLDAIAKASLAPTFGDIKDTTEGVIAALNQFGIGADKTLDVLGSLNAVSKRFAVESEDLISVIRRAGGVFATAAGQLEAPQESLSELIGIFTAVRSTTRESADTIATGLRTIFSRIQRRGTIDFLKQFNIELTDAEGRFVGFFDAFRRISDGLSEIQAKGDSITIGRIVEELGGIRQIGKILPAIQQFSRAEEARRVALEGTESITKDVAIATQTLSVQIEQLQARFQTLIKDITQSDTFQNLAKFALGAANAFVTLADALRPVLPLLTTVVGITATKGFIEFGKGFLGGIKRGGGAGGIGGGLANLATGGAASGSSSKGRINTKALEKQLAANTTSLKDNTGSVTKNTSSTDSLASGNKILKNAIDTLTNTVRNSSIRGGLGGGRGPRRRNLGGSIPKFRDGGMVEGPSHSQGGVLAELEGGEFVIPKKFVLGGLTRNAVRNPGRNPLSDIFQDNQAAGAKLPIQNTRQFGTFLKKKVGKKVSAADFGELSPTEQKALVKEFRGGKPAPKQPKQDGDPDNLTSIGGKLGRGRGARIVGAQIQGVPFGVTFLNNPPSNLQQTINGVLKDGNKTGKSRLNNLIIKELQRFGGPPGRDKTGRFGIKSGAQLSAPNAQIGTFRPNGKKAFEDEVEGGIPPIFENATRNFFAAAGISGPAPRFPLNQLVSKSAVGSISGQFFEAFTRAVGNQPILTGAQDDVDDIFDFRSKPQNADALFTKFTLPNEFKNTGSSIENIRNAISKSFSLPGAFVDFQTEVFKFQKKKPQGANRGGEIDNPNAILTPGEAIFSPKTVGQIGLQGLRNLNKTGDASQLGIRSGDFGIVPGVGSTDTVPATLAPGSFVVRKRSTEQGLQGLNKGGSVQRLQGGGKKGGGAGRVLGSLEGLAGLAFAAQGLAALDFESAESALIALPTVIFGLSSVFSSFGGSIKDSQQEASDSTVLMAEIVEDSADSIGESSENVSQSLEVASKKIQKAGEAAGRGRGQGGRNINTARPVSQQVFDPYGGSDPRSTRSDAARRSDRSADDLLRQAERDLDNDPVRQRAERANKKAGKGRIKAGTAFDIPQSRRRSSLRTTGRLRNPLRGSSRAAFGGVTRGLSSSIKDLKGSFKNIGPSIAKGLKPSIGALIGSLLVAPVAGAVSKAIGESELGETGLRGFEGPNAKAKAGAVGGISGAVTGGLIGASIGSLTGPLAPILTPIAAAAGAVIGGLNGLASALKKQKDFEIGSEFLKSIEPLGDAFEELEKDFSNTEALDKVIEAQNNLFTSTLTAASAFQANSGALKSFAKRLSEAPEEVLNPLSALAEVSGAAVQATGKLKEATDDAASTGNDLAESFQGSANDINNATKGLDTAIRAAAAGLANNETFQNAAQAIGSAVGTVSNGLSLLGDQFGQSAGVTGKLNTGFELFTLGLQAQNNKLAKEAGGFIASVAGLFSGQSGADFTAGAQGRVVQRGTGAAGLEGFESLTKAINLIPEDKLKKSAEIFPQAFTSVLSALSSEQLSQINVGEATTLEGLAAQIDALGAGATNAEEILKSFEKTAALSAVKQLDSDLSSFSDTLKGNVGVGVNNFVDDIEKLGVEASKANFSKSLVSQIQQGLKGTDIDFKEIFGDIDLTDLSALNTVFADLAKSDPKVFAQIIDSLGLAAKDVPAFTQALANFENNTDGANEAAIKGATSQEILRISLEKTAKTVDALAAGLDALTNRTSNAVSDFEVAATNIQNTIDNILSGDTTVTAREQVNPFENLAGRTTAELQSGIDRIIANVGNAGSFGGTAEILTVTRDLPAAFKKTFEALEVEGQDTGAAEFSTTQIFDEFINQLGPAFAGLPKVVQDDLEAGFAGLIGGRQGTDPIGLDKIKDILESEGADKLQQVFNEIGGKTQESFASLISSIDTLQAKFIESSNFQTAINKTQADAALTNLKRRQDIEERFSKFQNVVIDARGQAEQRLRDTINTQLEAGGAGAGLGAGATDPQALIDRRSQLQGERETLLAQLGQQAGGAVGGADVDDPATQDLIKKLGENSAALDGANSAIKTLSEDVSQLEAVEKELTKIQEARLTGRERAKLFAGRLGDAKGPRDQAKILQELLAPTRAAQKAQQGQALNFKEVASILENPEQIKDALNLDDAQLEQLVANATKGVEGGVGNLLEQFGVGGGVARELPARLFGAGGTAKGETKREQELLDEAKGLGDDRAKLTSAIADDNTRKLVEQQLLFQDEINKTAEALKKAGEEFKFFRGEVTGKPETEQPIGPEEAKVRKRQAEEDAAAKKVLDDLGPIDTGDVEFKDDGLTDSVKAEREADRQAEIDAARAKDQAAAGVPPQFANEPILGDSRTSTLTLDPETGAFSAVPKAQAQTQVAAPPGQTGNPLLDKFGTGTAGGTTLQSLPDIPTGSNFTSAAIGDAERAAALEQSLRTGGTDGIARPGQSGTGGPSLGDLASTIDQSGFNQELKTVEPFRQNRDTPRSRFRDRIARQRAALQGTVQTSGGVSDTQRGALNQVNEIAQNQLSRISRTQGPRAASNFIATQQDQQKQQALQDRRGTPSDVGGAALNEAATKFEKIVPELNRFAQDVSTAADKLSNLPELQVSLDANVGPVEVILNGASVIAQFGEKVKAEILQVVAQEIAKIAPNTDGSISDPTLTGR